MLNIKIMNTVITIVVICCVIAIVSGAGVGLYFGLKHPKDKKVACVLSDWSACSKDCDGTQTRKIEIHPKNGGKGCGPLSQDCGTKCQVDCETSDWSACSKDCDGTQTRKIEIHPKNGGKGCGPLSQHCGTPPPCPVDCETSVWSECDVACNKSTSVETGKQTRTVLTPSANGGRKCPPSPLPSGNEWQRSCSNTPEPCPKPDSPFKAHACNYNVDCADIAKKWYDYDNTSSQYYRCTGMNGNCTYYDGISLCTKDNDACSQLF